MADVNGKIGTAFGVLCLMLNCAVYGDKPAEIEISTEQTSIRVGEPLIIKLMYRWQKPLISPRTNAVLSKIDHYAYLNICEKDKGSLISRYPLFPAELELEGTEGLDYEGHFIILYDHYKNKIMFARPGTYTIKVEGWTKSSNVLSIEVKPGSRLEKRALALLADANDYHFLVSGELEHAPDGQRVLSDLEQVVGQCKETILAKWCAARLGLHYFRAFNKKYPGFKMFEVDQHEGEIKDPLFDQAHKYTTLGVGIPEEFSIREDVLYYAIRAEVASADYEKALFYLDELGRTYPRGKYGSVIPRIKQQILEYQSRVPAQREPEGMGVLPLAAYVAAAAAVGVAILLIMLLLKRRASRGSQ